MKVSRIAARRVAAAAFLVSASPLALSPAMADTPAPASSDSAPQDIVVTATKRSESLQTVPLAITAITGDQMKQHQVSSFDDYVKMLPSVSYQSFGPSQSQLSFRGITTGGDGSAAGPLPTAGFYIDETPVTTIASAVDLHIYDMARVEALAGPQGTLYGASSLSGTLRLITNKPVIGKWEGGIDVEGNKYGPGNGGAKVEGFLNIPVASNMALRVVGYYQHDGGYINNTATNRTYQRWHYDAEGDLVNSPLTVNNSQYAKNNFNPVDSAGGRAALLIDLDNNWTVTPAVIYQHQYAKGSFLMDPNAGDLTVHDFANEHNRDDWYLASLTIQGKLSDWDVTYSGSYFGRKVDNVSDYSYFTVAYDHLGAPDQSPAYYAGYTYMKDSMGNDIDPTQIVHTHDSYTKMSQELRVSSPAYNPWKLTAGAFWQRQTQRHIGDYQVAGLADNVTYQDAVTSVATPIAGAPSDDVYYTNLHRVDRDYAVFAEASYDITSKLTLIAGIRGFIADNTLDGFSGTSGSLTKSALVNNCAVVTVQACPNTNAKYVQSGETHKAELKWQITPTKMVYFTYSTGFRPGGINRPVTVGSASTGYRVQDIPNYKADTLTNYELGWKTSFFNKKLYLNGALFWEDWNNIQYSLPGILGIYYTVNAGTARSRGAEASMTWRAARGLTISANGTYADARLTSNFSSSDGTEVFAPAGTRLPVTPQWKINATARYETKLGMYDAFLQGGLNYQSSTTSQLRVDYEEAIGGTSGFTTADFSAGLSRDKWTITAFITNAFDSRGVLSKNSSCTPSICAAYERYYVTKPQQFGLRSSYRF